MRPRWLSVFGLLLLAACGGGGSKGAPSQDQSPGPTPTATPSPTPTPTPSPTPTPTPTAGPGPVGSSIQGTVTYDRVPATSAGLNYGATQKRPVRGAVVQLFDVSNAQSPSPIGDPTTTDESGHYALAIPSSPPASVAVVVLARTTTPPMKVQDNTSQGALYALTSAPFAPAAGTKDLHAPSGWTGSAYGDRLAAPFAILDSMYTAAHAFLSVRPNATFAPLVLNWSPNNAPQAGDKTQGQIGTSHYSSQDGQLYILGLEDTDTDEFDDHVIVHEWGHYFEFTLSRSDSRGGTHSAGDLKDPRLAFGEGWGNAVSAMTLGDPVYRDTTGPKQARGFGDDMSSTSGDPNPGFFSERSVSKILYGLWAPSGAALGLGPVYDVMVGPEKTTPALTSIYSFASGLKAAQAGKVAQIDAITAQHGVHVKDIWGTDETNFPQSWPAPLYIVLSAGDTGPLVLNGNDGTNAIPPNDLAQNYYFRFRGDGGSHTVATSDATPGQDIDIRVYHRGEVVARGETDSGNETATFTAQSNEDYVVVVTGFGTAGSYGATFTFN